VVVHDRFGTATVLAGDTHFDVAGARTETYERPGALPAVRPASLDDDLGRRDFTVNAIAVELGPPDPGRVHAHPAALADLEGKRLRVLHEGSFLDDPTRILRALRYAHRLGFGLEPDTEALLDSAVAAGALRTVSRARIGDELRLLTREDDPAGALAALTRHGVAAALHPAFVPDGGAREALELLGGHGRADLLALAWACAGIAPADLRAWLDGLEYGAAERETSVAAAGVAPLEDARDSELAARLRATPAEAVAAAGARGSAAAASRWLEALRHVRTSITGEDLLAAGVPEGPDIGRALEAALTARLDGAATDRADELRAALGAIGRG
jgi:tRNA nucleotidyltransferase (CCA-adding enzyme)